MNERIGSLMAEIRFLVGETCASKLFSQALKLSFATTKTYEDWLEYVKD